MPTLWEELSTYETLLKAHWTPEDGVVITWSVLPETWSRALRRIGRDLRVRHFNGAIAHVQFEAEHRVYRDNDEGDYISLLSAVTPVGDVVHGLMHDGEGVLADADEELIVQRCVYAVQDRIARTGILWPRGNVGGCLSVALIDGTATWVGDPEGKRSPIGELAP